jgi:hypothetical protein
VARRGEPPGADDDAVVCLLEEDAAASDPSSPPSTGDVSIKIVREPSKLLDGRQGRLHEDVVDALVDLLVELVGGEEEGGAR